MKDKAILEAPDIEPLSFSTILLLIFLPPIGLIVWYSKNEKAKEQKRDKREALMK